MKKKYFSEIFVSVRATEDPIINFRGDLDETGACDVTYLYQKVIGNEPAVSSLPIKYQFVPVWRTMEDAGVSQYLPRWRPGRAVARARSRLR